MDKNKTFSEIPISWTLRVLLILATSGTTAAFSCSQCESLPGGTCMTSPPPSSPCESQDGDHGNINCMIARHLSDNGTLVFYSRGCTMVPVGDGCVSHSDNVTLCYQICHYDKCNLATRFYSNRWETVLCGGLLLYRYI